MKVKQTESPRRRQRNWDLEMTSGIKMVKWSASLVFFFSGINFPYNKKDDDDE